MQRYRIWHGDISISSTRLNLGGQCCRMIQDVTLPLQNIVLAAFCPGQAIIFHVRFFRSLYRQWQCAHAEFPTGCQVHCVENWSRLSFVYASKHWHSLTQKSTCIEHAVWICYPVMVDTHLVKETIRCSISKVWWTSVHSPRCYFFASRRECTSCTFIVNGRGLTYRYLCHSRLVPDDLWSQLKYISMHIKHTQIRAGRFNSCAFSNSPDGRWNFDRPAAVFTRDAAEFSCRGALSSDFRAVFMHGD